MFLEGVADAGGTLPGFGFVLHLLYLVGLGDRATRHGDGGPQCVERIAACFRELGCPLRNAGALLMAQPESACGGQSARAPGIHDLDRRGAGVPQMVLSHPLLGVMDQAEEPGLDSAEFHDLVRFAADSLSDSEIRHWLRHGRGPRIKPTTIVPLRPRRLAETLAEMERRPRLAAVGRLVSRLEGMVGFRRVSLRGRSCKTAATQTSRPGRSRADPANSIRTRWRGVSEAVCRAQLLYFHREEPRQPTTDEMIILLDQCAPDHIII